MERPSEEAFCEAARRVPHVTVTMDSVEATSLIGLAQLGMRHPHLAHQALAAQRGARRLIAAIRQQLPPAMQAAIDAGFGRACDARTENG
jgi:hypothetical protein